MALGELARPIWIGATDDESLKALHRSVDMGLNFIDTALVYGNGHLKIHRWICNFYQ
jgi:aryl-alcohol dehydrogenase-like predicted oxidoreductase